MAVKYFAIAAVGLLLTCPANAAFVDWWLTPDQQGRLHYERGEYNLAAQSFTDPLWKGLAYYASADFASAASWLSQVDTAYARFYLGNALAHLDRLPEAIDAYNAALELEPGLDEARFNLEWVSGIYELSRKEYDDYGGTGGQLGADDFVFSDRAKNAEQTMTDAEAASQGLSDQQIEDIWMRRVQTTPAEFLAYKFAYQLEQGEDR